MWLERVLSKEWRLLLLFVITGVLGMLHESRFDGRIEDRDLATAFQQREGDLADFAEKHSLFVRKYIHNYPIWGFYFRHPSGGEGTVQLSLFRKPDGQLGAAVFGEWHLDDHDKLVRSTYSIALKELTSADSTLVTQALESYLSTLLTAPPSARSTVTRIAPRPKDVSGQTMYSEFERALQVAK
jgi:hypothetical protein